MINGQEPWCCQSGGAERLVCWAQLLVIFDADMVCSQEFFTKIVAELYDPQVALVLTPQVLHSLLLAALRCCVSCPFARLCRLQPQPAGMYMQYCGPGCLGSQTLGPGGLHAESARQGGLVPAACRAGPCWWGGVGAMRTRWLACIRCLIHEAC